MELRSYTGSIYNDENDDVADTIREDASDAATHAWGPGGCQRRANPFTEGSEEYECWNIAFHSEYARENH